MEGRPTGGPNVSAVRRVQAVLIALVCGIPAYRSFGAEQSILAAGKSSRE